MHACEVQAVEAQRQSSETLSSKACESKYKKRATSFSYSFIPPCAGHCVDLETAIQRCEKAAPETLPLTKRNI